MPLFTTELNRIADNIAANALTFRLHTAAPSDASPTNGRTTAGGTGYENGVVIAAGDISAASNGDIEVDVDIDFGAADEAVGSVGWLSAYRGNSPVGWWVLPSTTTIANGDSFKINANSLEFNGATT